MPRLDVSAWNLFASALMLAAGCGTPSKADEQKRCQKDPDCECVADAYCSSPTPACEDEQCRECLYDAIDLCESGTACEDREECSAAPVLPECGASVDLGNAIPIPRGGAIRLAHVDDDSMLDLLVLDGDTAYLVRGPFDAAPEPVVTVAGAELRGAAADDMTGDGDVDIALIGYDGTWLFEGDGAGGFAQVWSDPQLYGEQLQTGDFDDDGVKDLAALAWGSSYGGVFIAPVDGTIPLSFEEIAQHAYPERGMVAADLRGGPGTDLAFADFCNFECGPARYAVVGDAGDAYESNFLSLLGGGATTAASLQLDGSGHDELITAGLVDRYGVSDPPEEILVQAFAATEVGSLGRIGAWTIRARAPFSFRTAAGDLDGDGNPDMAIGGTEDLLVHYRDGAEPDSGCLVTYTLLHDVTEMATGDIDGDGDDELVISDGASKTTVHGL